MPTCSLYIIQLAYGDIPKPEKDKQTTENHLSGELKFFQKISGKIKNKNKPLAPKLLLFRVCY